MIRPNFQRYPVLLLALFCAADNETQAQSRFGSRGPASQIGTNLSGSRVGNSTTLGSSLSAGLSGQPLTGGQTGLTGSNTPGMSAAGGLQSGAAGTQEGFIGRNGNNRGFVGNQLAGQQSASGGFSRQPASLGNRGVGGTGQGFNRTGMNSQSGRSRPAIRPQQRIAFSYPQPRASSIQSSLTGQFQRAGRLKSELQGVNISVDAMGLAVLHGSVDSEESKKLAQVIARLEPGVRSVQNDLTVDAGHR